MHYLLKPASIFHGSRDIALDMICRFLAHSGVIASRDVQSFLAGEKLLCQRFIQITQSVAAQSMEFSFAADYKGLEIIRKAGTVIARDGDLEIVTPYDDCVIVQPSLRHLGPGVTVMRLGRVVDKKGLQAVA
jgi:hypothetical protein